MRLLRWGTFLLLIVILVGAVLSYPILRDRFFSPILAAQASEVELLTVDKSAALAATDVPTTTPRPTLPLPTSNATTPALIIEAPKPTATIELSRANTPTVQSQATSTPAAFATTSLLPSKSDATNTPAVISPASVEQTRVTQAETQTVELTNVLTNSTAVTTTPVVTGGQVTIQYVTPTPPATPATGEEAQPGEKGYEVPTTTAAALTGTPQIMTPLGVTPVAVTPMVVTTVEIASSTGGGTVTPIVVTTIELTPPLGSALLEAIGPTANSNSPLYGGPDFAAPIVGQVAIGDQLTIVGLYTEGSWYLLVTGMWIPGAAVNNAPLTMPLVFPTITPVPTTTPTVTPTPFPTATLVGSPTATATPTSLDQAVCDCSGDNLDCLGNIFANRAQAQQCFEYCFRQTGKDIHLLDPNVNGMACENLP